MFQNHLWFHSNQKFMWSSVCYVMFPRVVCKFSNREKLTPGGRLSRCPGSQILFNPGIHSFCLSISARVKGCGKILLNSKCLAHFFCKCRGKLGIMVQDDPFGKSEPRYKVFQILKGYICSVNCFRAWNEFSCFRIALIDDCENGIKAL